jgi:hypothetical protein
MTGAPQDPKVWAQIDAEENGIEDNGVSVALQIPYRNGFSMHMRNWIAQSRPA